MDRDHWGYELDEASPPDGDARPKEVAPAPGERRLPDVALPNHDGDAVEAIRSIVGFPDGTDPAEWYTAPETILTKMVFTETIISVPRLG